MPAPGRTGRLPAVKFAAAFALAALGSATTMGEGLLSAGAAAVAQATDLVADRSPGARTGASITKGKPRIDVGRVARALPRIRDARASSHPPAARAAQALPRAAAAAPVAAAAPALVGPAVAEGPVAFFGAPGGGGGFISGPGVFLPSFGGGGGGGGGIVLLPPEESPPETVVPPVAAPVPEPSSWALLIVGFGVIGAALRTSKESRLRNG
ncbi:PEPxxWA-CTERM sorting domain-containing protein [Sphingomonas sp. ID1715]|uniref:PEPxxWA-CTERM sorting domain-containing protein n=1 Tax=Sphingomonas sp. ID1715 TaxID=1656898 RepID=UPI00148A02F8|nr:PEPxxWA-CTERM sorting domain-containing protein [Sphingomonas sp. ID1715]NNM78152.1 PEPxxWA-CTERM sorting domain-containing protein [Sphingomonas sp. ID1715]